MRWFWLFILTLIMPALSFSRNGNDSLTWLKKQNKEYTLYYSSSDQNLITNLEAYLDKGIRSISSFFGKNFKKHFSVYVFPNRKQLDKQWQKMWNDTSFRSECWMVASGTGDRLDIVSFNSWVTDACEHKATDSLAVQKLITHELTHVFHGQYNPTGDFTGMDDMGWLVEGLATFVSGQLDNVRIKQLKTLLEKNELPGELKKIWKGKTKYGNAASLIQYIDAKYGRKKLFNLLKFTTDKDALVYLKITETDLIKNWKIYIDKKL